MAKGVWKCGECKANKKKLENTTLKKHLVVAVCPQCDSIEHLKPSESSSSS